MEVEHHINQPKVMFDLTLTRDSKKRTSKWTTTELYCDTGQSNINFKFTWPEK